MRVEEYANYVNKLRQNDGLETWIWRQIVMSQIAHTKYKWPSYSIEWNPHEIFLRTPLLTEHRVYGSWTKASLQFCQQLWHGLELKDTSRHLRCHKRVSLQLLLFFSRNENPQQLKRHDDVVGTLITLHSTEQDCSISATFIAHSSFLWSPFPQTFGVLLDMNRFLEILTSTA